ncbi:hypothetical protein HDA33_000224 [Micrococcus endophyticus]|uniref:Uncharacterized protein n=1 Tax=Micrococcus endophyticus TaxID=455343 RepID=A0A7W9JGU1_9MICC|nr:hypothetical protein [Micrococcus endophyticus]MBB5847660.1 hypothetical protein [Micrococcus endophyticus]
MEDTTAPASAGRAALDALADARVSASFVILALVAYFAWRLVVRRRRVESAPARPTMLRSTMHRLQSSPAVRALTERLSGRVSGLADSARAAGRRTAGLQVRWGRTALFLAALAALAVALVAGVAAAFGAGTAGLAGACLLFAVAAVAGLRALAVRDRARRAPAAVVEAPAEAAPHAAPEAARVDPERDRRVFETVLALEDEAPRVSAAAPAAPAAAAPTVVAASAVRAPEATDTVTLPVVPRPTYLDAPEMLRPAPAPLTAPEAAGSDVRLKDAARAAEHEEALSATAEQDVAALDLDHVLARRRAS